MSTQIDKCQHEHPQQAETDRYDQQMELEEEHYNPGQALQQGFNTSYNTNELEQQYLQAQQVYHQDCF